MHDGTGAGPDPAAHEEPARIGGYRLVQTLGEGGMGVVHLALDRAGRAVALKVLRPHIALDPEARARLAREVATLERVRSPRVAPILDADVEAGRPFIVTKFIDGESLESVVDIGGPLAAGPLARLGRGLAEALEAIHAAGVIHRDLKPGNVLLVEGDPVVIDFGIAHVADDTRLTMAGHVMGTPGYLAPEVVEGEDVTEATDWWGWAATMAFAATGASPFGRGPMDAVLARVVRGEPDLRAADPRIAALLYAALSPRTSERPTADEVVAAIERYAAGGVATEAIAIRRPPPAATQQFTVPRTTQFPTPHRPDAPVPHRPEATAQQGPEAPALHRPDAPALHRPDAPTPPPALPVAPSAGPPAQVPSATAARGSAALAPRPAPAAAQPVGPAVGPPMGPPMAPSMGRPMGPPAGPAPVTDPRIGRDDRTGTLSALLLLLAAAASVAPLIAGAGLCLWMVFARTSDRAVTSLLRRRHTFGHRSSDVPLAIVSTPWHVLVAAASALLALVVPAIAATSVAFTVALLVGQGSGTIDPTAMLPLGLAGATAGFTAWWGPGGASLRRGSRSLVRTLSPTPSATVFAIVLVLAALALAWWGWAHGAPTWWPRSGSAAPWSASGIR